MTSWIHVDYFTHTQTLPSLYSGSRLQRVRLLQAPCKNEHIFSQIRTLPIEIIDSTVWLQQVPFRLNGITHINGTQCYLRRFPCLYNVQVPLEKTWS